MASFSIPLTGLEADSTALNTIANNLSNMNTTAYKAQTAQFSNLFYQQLGSSGSGDPIEVGAGSQVASTQTSFTEGSISSTGQSTDMAIDGSGFFVANDNGSTVYTRAGNFTLASNGNLTTQGGADIMGYPAVNGVANTNAPLAAINIPTGQVEAPKATGSFTMTTNLNADTSSSNTFSNQIKIYDSLGIAHQATVSYTNTGTNTWSYSVSLPASEFTSGVSTPVTGTMAFDASGNLTIITPTAGAPQTVGTATGDVSSIPVSFTGLKDGANNLTMNWNLLGSSGTPVISQVAAPSAVSATDQDGYASGQYESFSVGSDGKVSVKFSNNETLVVGQLALANVTNPQGLQILGGGNYAVTRASGAATIGVAGTGGLGTVDGGALEGSNVNISAEFSNLIVAQRAFEANSKAVTTFDTVTEQTIQMIH